MKLYKYTGNIILTDIHNQNKIIEKVVFFDELFGNENLLIKSVKEKIKTKWNCHKHKYIINIQNKTLLDFELDYKTGVNKIYA